MTPSKTWFVVRWQHAGNHIDAARGVHLLAAIWPLSRGLSSLRGMISVTTAITSMQQSVFTSSRLNKGGVSNIGRDTGS